MTGEIGIHGECKEMEGLVSNYGAKRAGVGRLVCMQKANEMILMRKIKEQDAELIETIEVQS